MEYIKIDLLVADKYLTCDNCCINYMQTGKGFCQYESIHINDTNKNMAKDCQYFLPDGTNRAFIKREATDNHKCWYEEID